jgi:hypothetical protein
MNVNQYAGWTLVLGTILLLVTVGRVDLLLILLPLSLLLAFVIGCSGHHKNRADERHQKGVA